MNYTLISGKVKTTILKIQKVLVYDVKNGI